MKDRLSTSRSRSRSRSKSSASEAARQGAKHRGRRARDGRRSKHSRSRSSSHSRSSSRSSQSHASSGSSSSGSRESGEIYHKRRRGSRQKVRGEHDRHEEDTRNRSENRRNPKRDRREANASSASGEDPKRRKSGAKDDAVEASRRDRPQAQSGKRRASEHGYLPYRLRRSELHLKVGKAHQTGSSFRTLTEYGEPRLEAVDQPVQSVNGYILFCSNIPEDCEREYIEDMFMDQGAVKSLQLPKDPASGGLKGYAIVSYESRFHAENAIKNLNETEIMDRHVKIGWAFVNTAKGGARDKRFIS